jgi:hypothetical protein
MRAAGAGIRVMDALRAAAAEGEAQQDEAVATARQELQLVDEQLYEAAHDMRDARRRPPLDYCVATLDILCH